MSLVKSFSVGDGDMFYIKHGSDSFSIIDCCLVDERKVGIVKEIKNQSMNKGIVRFISTHPDNDHILGLPYLNGEMKILNFYCVRNEATKPDETDNFNEYCMLRDDSDKAFYLYKGCSRKWLNDSDGERGGAGISIPWPILSNAYYIAELENAKNGESPNNISPIISYGIKDGASFLWMGDLEHELMDNIKDEIALDSVDILFAPHHGRESGKVPKEWLDVMQPRIVIIGEAPSVNLNYYPGFNTITQNSAGDIAFDCAGDKIHIYVSNENYRVNFLNNEYLGDNYGYYLGTLNL